MLRMVLTHPGGAHKDDLLAVCVLIAKHGVPVLRREPTVEELNDPEVAIVDVGGSHDPQRMNFDHHHFDREHPPTCALSLVLAHYELYEAARALCEWLEPAEWFDSRGPNKTAEWLGVPRRAISQLNSPIDITLLRRFANTTRLESGDPLYEFMRYVGQDLLQYLEEAQQRIAFAEAHVESWTVPVGDTSLEALFLPRTDPPVDEPSAALSNYVRFKGLDERTAALVYPDRRGGGYGIRRYEDHPAFDFSRVASEPDVHFAHKSGFMCKTSATDPARLRLLISKAANES